MHLLVIGGSGRTGQLLILEALHRGHTVTALVRKLDSIEAQPGLKVLQGTPLEKAGVESAFMAIPGRAPDVVLVALGQTRTCDNPFAAPTSPPQLMADAHRILISAMKQHHTKKIVTMSAYGTGDSFPAMNCLMRLIMRKSNMSYTFADHDLVDSETKKSGVGFVLVRPAMLKGEEALPIQIHGNTGEGAGLMPSISRKSVVGFLLDAVEQDTWNNNTPVISN